MIRASQLIKNYNGSDFSMRGINLWIEKGELVFVIGPSGAGKSTLIKLLVGLERPTSGTVFVGGSEVSSLRGRKLAAARREISVIFQDYKLIKRLTALENVMVPLQLKGVRDDEAEALARISLEKVGLLSCEDALPNQLSGGEQQRVAVARALANRPRVIVADEPTGNLDRRMTKEIFSLLKEANKDGTTVVVATHNMEIVEEFKSRTILLDRGEMVGDFFDGQLAA